MSEPLTSNEIEDVLSSIRRLVSEDLRPARAAMAVEAAKGAEADKLMLTPALRVVSDKAEAEALAAAPDAQPHAALPDRAQAPAEGRILTPGGADAETADWSFAPDDDGMAPGTALGGQVVHDDWAAEDWADDALSPQVATDDAALHPAAALSAAFPPMPDAGYDDDGLNGPQAMAAEDQDIIWAATGEVEPEEKIAAAGAAPGHGHWTAQDVPGMDWAQEETSWVEPDPPSFVAHPRKPELTSDPLARAWADRAEDAVRAELGEAPAARATVMPPPAAEAAQAGPDDLGTGRAAPSRDSGLFDGDEAALDEEMLRDIVRDIIREELAGALGERITRNVRKLVRVEINRALAAREFE